MKHFLTIIRNIVSSLTLTFLVFSLLSCSHEDPEVRNQDDILGVWSPSADRYLRFEADNTVINLVISHQDNESIGDWTRDVYFYEPGYDIVIYMDDELQANLYKVIKLTKSEMTLCWIENIRDEYDSGQSIGEIIGGIIKDAHDGYDINPANFVSYKKISDNDYYTILQGIDIMEPWWED